MSIRTLVDVRLKPGVEEDLGRAYAALLRVAEQQPGLISHQLCQAVDDQERWLVISEWESVEALKSWEQSEEHHRLTGPMRECFAQADRTGFHVRDGVRTS